MTTPTPRTKNSSARLIIVVIIAFAGIWFYMDRNTKKTPEYASKEAQLKVAQEAETQYEVAKRNGTAMDVYVRAGLVAEAYLQANDQENYKKWKQIEADAATEAGITK